MKKLTLLIALLLMGGVNSFSQEKKTTPERIKLVPSSHQSKNTKSKAEQIKDLEAHLEAIDAKEAYIRKSPEETKIAQKNGWFENAEKQRKEIKAKIQELKK